MIELFVTFIKPNPNITQQLVITFMYISFDAVAMGATTSNGELRIIYGGLVLLVLLIYVPLRLNRRAAGR